MKLAKEGWPFVLVPLALVPLVAFSPWPVSALLPLAAALFSAWFFRDPERTPPQDPQAWIAPADGKVLRVAPDRVAIFMNVFDVHVCRSPVAGTIGGVDHREGRFLAAWRDEAPDVNERCLIDVQRSEGGTARFTLIAGLVARRIVTRVAPGQSVAAGDRIGLIRFGSRVDVDLPAGVTPCVQVGQRVCAGETVLARTEGETS